jgi:hypothetical protein
VKFPHVRAVGRGAGLADGKIKERIVELGGTVVGGSPADLARR